MLYEVWKNHYRTIFWYLVYLFIKVMLSMLYFFNTMTTKCYVIFFSNITGTLWILSLIHTNRPLVTNEGLHMDMGSTSQKADYRIGVLVDVACGAGLGDALHMAHTERAWGVHCMWSPCQTILVCWIWHRESICGPNPNWTWTQHVGQVWHRHSTQHVPQTVSIGHVQHVLNPAPCGTQRTRPIQGAYCIWYPCHTGPAH